MNAARPPEDTCATVRQRVGKPVRGASPQTAARNTQRGAALLTAMVIVTLIATITVGMIWQQWRAIQVEAAERTQTQARWILDGALDWARLILREDLRGSKEDHLGEPWAVELKEARLSTFLAADKDNTDDAPDAFLSGRIRDAQARFNIINLIDGNGKFQPKNAAALAKLCELAGSNNQVAALIAAALKSAHPGSDVQLPQSAPPPPVPTSAPPNPNAPLMPTRMAELTWLGIDEATVARLEPFIVILPKATPVNINTAPKEVIAAATEVDLSSAQRIVQRRISAPFKTLDEAQTLLGLKDPLDGNKVSVKSDFFEVDGALRIERLVVAQRSLVERNNQGVVKILRTDRVLPGSNPAIQLQQ